MRYTVLCLAVVSALAASAPAPDATELLRTSDRVRNGWTSFEVRVQISNFEQGKEDEEHLFAVYLKGADKSYVDFLSPREKGTHLLMLGDDMWIYLPDTTRPVRITPLERLTGNTSNGDVARTNWATDYDATWLRTESVAGVDCHVLDLRAKRKGATYRRITLWVRARDARPAKADFFAASGKQLKSATYDKYEVISGQTLLRRMTIYDSIRSSSRSVIDYLSYSPRALPDRLFHQGRTERF